MCSLTSHLMPACSITVADGLLSMQGEIVTPTKAHAVHDAGLVEGALEPANEAANPKKKRRKSTGAK